MIYIRRIIKHRKTNYSPAVLSIGEDHVKAAMHIGPLLLIDGSLNIEGVYTYCI